MIKILIRWIITTLAVFLAARLVPGITVQGSGWVVYAVMAAVLGLVSAVVRPILKLLTCPLILLTLGLFTLVINAATLWLSSEIVNWLWPNMVFNVDGFWPAFWGALIVSVVTAILSALVKEEDDKR
jgi:putative membrane protein